MITKELDMSVNIWKELRIRVTSVHVCILIAYVFVMVYFYEHYEKNRRLGMYEKKVGKLVTAIEKIESIEKQTQHIVSNVHLVIEKKLTNDEANANAAPAIKISAKIENSLPT